MNYQLGLAVGLELGVGLGLSWKLLERKKGSLGTGQRSQRSTGGSVVEFSPATREARVRFPASARQFLFFFISFENFLF